MERYPFWKSWECKEPERPLSSSIGPVRPCALSPIQIGRVPRAKGRITNGKSQSGKPSFVQYGLNVNLVNSRLILYGLKTASSPPHLYPPYHRAISPRSAVASIFVTSLSLAK